MKGGPVRAGLDLAPWGTPIVLLDWPSVYSNIDPSSGQGGLSSPLAEAEVMQDLDLVAWELEALSAHSGHLVPAVGRWQKRDVQDVEEQEMQVHH